MIPQTFRADNMLEALAVVQKELGPEALIISVRNVPLGPAWQVWKQQGVEVVAMPSAATTMAVPPPNAPMAAAGVPAARDGTREFPLPEAAAPKKESIAAPAVDFEALLRKEAQKAKTAPKEASAIPTALLPWEARLRTQGVDPEFLARILRHAADTLSPHAMENDRTVREHIRAQLQVDLRARDMLSAGGRRVLCLIGASGCGKTSTCAKIAAHTAKTLGRRVAWISADTLRAGSIAKTRALTDPLGIPLRLAYSPDELAALVQEEVAADIVLVDMPGCNPYNEEDVVELGSFLTAIEGRITLLVAAAPARDLDLHDALAAFAPFDVKGLAISKMDETRYYGGVYNFARRSRLPIVLFTAGSRVLGDLLTPDSATLPGVLLGEGMRR